MEHSRGGGPRNVSQHRVPARISKPDGVSARLLRPGHRAQWRMAMSTKSAPAPDTVCRQEDTVLRTRGDERQPPLQLPDAVLAEAQGAHLRAELGKPALGDHLSEGMALAGIEPSEVQRQPAVESQECRLPDRAFIEAAQSGNPDDDQRIWLDHHECRRWGFGLLRRGEQPQQGRRRNTVGRRKAFQEAVE